MRNIKTQDDLRAELADIEARYKAGELTRTQRKRAQSLARVALDAYETSRLKTIATGGKGAA